VQQRSSEPPFDRIDRKTLNPACEVHIPLRHNLQQRNGKWWPLGDQVFYNCDRPYHQVDGFHGGRLFRAQRYRKETGQAEQLIGPNNIQ
jgi:hypothetical protein